MGNLTTTLTLDAGEVFHRHVVVRAVSTESMDDAVAQCQKKIKWYQKYKPGAYFIERSSVSGAKPLDAPKKREYTYDRYNYQTKQTEPYTATYTILYETTYIARVVQLTPVTEV